MLRIIGDVHGQINELHSKCDQTYVETITDVPYSVQLGDMGDLQTYEELSKVADATCHRFFPGNHDDYDHLPPHCLGDFGMTSLGGIDFFFVRGAWSIDKASRIDRGRRRKKKIWFAQEELNAEQMGVAKRDYQNAMPEVVLSHDGPDSVARRVVWSRRYQPTATSLFLQELLEIYQPRIWIFGHHHRDWAATIQATEFRCLAEMSYVDLNSES